MVLETTGHCSALSRYTPIPNKLFRAEPSVNAIGIEGSMDVALLIASSRLPIAAGTQWALENILGPHPTLFYGIPLHTHLILFFQIYDLEKTSIE